MSQLVSYTLRDGLAEIIMDDGKANIMSVAMLSTLADAFAQARSDEAITVLRSARAGLFSAGFDLKVFAAGDADASLAMVRAGAELALQLMEHPHPIVGVVEGHAFPMGAFLLLGCDVRLGVEGAYGMGLNEVVIGIAPPGFAIELARSRLHPAWLARTVTTGVMYAPGDAMAAGFIDHLAQPGELEARLGETIESLRKVHRPSHAVAKRRLRADAIAAMRAAIDAELTPEIYRASSAARG